MPARFPLTEIDIHSRSQANSSFDIPRSPATLPTEFLLVGKRVSRFLSCPCHGRSEASRNEVAISEAVIAGWTGRDPVAVEKHIKELEALGVKRPATTPIFYRVAAARITTDDSIEAGGATSGGEGGGL